jgi:6-pyruvoyltetrahydropterin/6-carboxytetrahydropterin synthase
MYQICKTFSFDAAHYLRGYNGNCARLHGHRWEVAVCLEGESLDAIGLLFDFKDLKAITQRATNNYDHNVLNEISPYDEVNPSSENLARTIYQVIRDEMRTTSPAIHLAFVQVWESPTSWAKYWE